MNLENSKTSKSHVLKLKFTSKLDLRLGEKVKRLLPYQTLVFITHGEM